MEKKYLNSGVLFAENKRNEKSPDFKGNIEFDSALLTYLVNQLNAGKDAKVEVSGWRRTSSKGTTFISLQVKQPYREGTTGQQQPQRQQQGSSNPWD